MQRARVLAAVAGAPGRPRGGRGRAGLRPARAVRAHAAVGHARGGERLDPARLGAGARLPRRLRDRLPPPGVGGAERAPARRADASRGVPDGQPTQPDAAPRTASPAPARAGTIIAAAPELQFEGDGTYTVTVSVGPGTATADCLRGPVDHRLVRRRRARRAVAGRRAAQLPRGALPGGPVRRRAGAGAARRRRPTSAARSTAPCSPTARSRARSSCREPASSHPPSSSGVPAPRRLDVRRARDRRGQGRRASTSPLFAYALVRAARVEVRSDFRRRTGAIARPCASGRASPFMAEWPAEARGGRGTVTLSRFTGCRGESSRLRRVGRAARALRRPAHAADAHAARASAGFYLGRFAFSGTRFLRAGVDPNPMLRLRCGATGWSTRTRRDSPTARLPAA